MAEARLTMTAAILKVLNLTLQGWNTNAGGIHELRRKPSPKKGDKSLKNIQRMIN